MYTWEPPQGPLKEPQGTEVSEKRHRHISEDNDNFENPFFHELFFILSHQHIKNSRNSEITFFLVSKGF